MNNFDTIIIGAGHNGLITGSYLQKKGLQTMILESRNTIGVACVTEELFPGYKISSLSYVCSLLRPKIIKDLKLFQHGLQFLERNPSSFTPFPDDRYLMFWSDSHSTKKEIAKFSEKDAKNYDQYEETLKKLSYFVNHILMKAPVDPLSKSPIQLLNLLGLGLKARNLDTEIYNKVRILSQSSVDFLNRYFESEELKSTLATDGVIGAFQSPYDPGTAYVLLHHVMGETFGRSGVWAYVKGGMGGITQAIASFYASKGGKIRTNAKVSKILIKNGKAYGVVLSNGDEILAKRIISNLDPKRTFLHLVESGELPAEFLNEVKQIKMSSPVFKINLALNKLPNFRCLPTTKQGPNSHLNGTIHISPNLKYIHDAYLEARNGEPSTNPILECTIPSMVDNTLAPKGFHVMNMFVQYAPFNLKTGSWDKRRKDEFTQRCISTMEEYAPGFKNSIEHIQAISPQDMETEYGLTGGSLFHGDMSLDQLFFMRYLPQYSNYKTPIESLYMCGSGTHPGGGVMGASGYNAAQMILSEAKSLF